MSSADDAEIARDVQCTECGTLYDRPHGYRTSFTRSGGETVSALALPAIAVSLPDLFPA